MEGKGAWAEGHPWEGNRPDGLGQGFLVHLRDDESHGSCKGTWKSACIAVEQWLASSRWQDCHSALEEGSVAGLLRSPACLLFAGVRGEECRKSGSDSGGVSAVPSLMPSGGVTKNRSGGLYINIQAHFLTF